MYLFFRAVEFASFYDFLVIFCYCSDGGFCFPFDPRFDCLSDITNIYMYCQLKDVP